MLRWAWRQLTSMRVALMLLMALAVVAVPGSVLPQRNQNLPGVVQFYQDNPRLAPWLDRFGFFQMYTSVWFSAIYLLLFISLIGCIIPRTITHAKALRAQPGKVPPTFARFPAQASASSELPLEQLQAKALAALRRPNLLGRYRVRSFQTGAHQVGISAERGYLRESGNLLFHLALLGLLVSVALGQMLHYRAQVLVVQGTGFANSVIHFNSFEHGAWFAPDSLDPFTITLDNFESNFTQDAQARRFVASVTVQEPAQDPYPATIRVNHPLNLNGVKVYLQGNGYAPQITVRDGAGEVSFAGTVPFIPEDSVYTSRGVIKVPDVSTGPQIGLQGYFLPSAVIDDTGAYSLYPQPLNPLLILTVYTGDLGLDNGIPQNVYQLDTSKMTQATEASGVPVTLLLAPGQTVDLPDGLGTITFEQLHRYAGFDLRYDPMLHWILLSAVFAVLGLILSLFVPRRRVWLRITSRPGEPCQITAAGLARGDDVHLQTELDRIMQRITAWPHTKAEA